MKTGQSVGVHAWTPYKYYSYKSNEWTTSPKVRENRFNLPGDTQTIKNHLTAIKGFIHWLYVNAKLDHDPLASVKMPNAKADRRCQRRMLLHDEWEWLRMATTANPDRYGMTGQARMLLYATAIQTGLRSNELRSLSRGNLFLANDKPYITCSVGSTKNRKDARQYIQADLADELKDHVATKAPRSPVFAMPPEWDVADMLREDLADARREWLEAATGNPKEYERRAQGDFLTVMNHEKGSTWTSTPYGTPAGHGWP